MGFTMKDMKGLKVKKMKLFCLSKSVAANRDCAWHPHGRYIFGFVPLMGASAMG